MKLSWKTRWTALAAGLMDLAVACGGSDPTATLPATAKPEPASIIPVGSSLVPRLVPALDQSIHSGPLEDIVFDTFGTVSARFVPLSEISEQLQTNPPRRHPPSRPPGLRRPENAPVVDR